MASGSPARVVGALLLVGAMGVLSWNAVRLAEYVWQAAHYPYQLDYGEGPLLSQIDRLEEGEAIYQPLAPGAFAIANYPPFYHRTVRLADALLGSTVLAGRAVSGLATFLCAVLVAALSWRTGGAATSLPRALAAATAGLLYLGVLYVYMWAPLVRVDMLALLLSLFGVLTFALLAPSPAALAAAVPFALALFTKQTAVAGLAACILVALRRAPRLALGLAAATGVLAVALYALEAVRSGGWIYFHLVTANSGQYVWEQALPYLSDLGGRYPTLLALAVVSALSMARRGGDDWSRPVLAAYLLTAAAVSLTVGKTGAHVNYLLELMAVAMACVGAGLAEALAATPHRRASAAEQIVAVAFPALVLLRAVALVGGPEQDWADSLRTLPRAEAAQALSLVESAGGPVLSQDMTLLALTDMPIEYQPFEMTQLARTGAWDPAPLLAELESSHFALLLLELDVAAEPERGRNLFTPEMLAAIDAHYVVDEHIGPYVVYRPRRR